MLSKQQVEEFHRRGVLRVEGVVKPDMADSIVSGVEPLYEESSFASRRPGTRYQNAWKEVDAVRQLARDARIMKALSQLFGRKALPFQTLNFPFGTRQKAHSDTIHFNSKPSGYMAGVWVALEDIDEHNGPLIYYPGSHVLPEKNMQDLGLEPGYEKYHLYEHAIEELIEAEQLQPELGLARKGDLIIWHANLLHGGYGQSDPARTRHSQVTHYYFEDCQYFRPMDATLDQIEYLYPEWISRTPFVDPSSPNPEDFKHLPLGRKLRIGFGKLRRGKNPFDFRLDS